MILEEETYEQFGYYPGDLKPQSCKKIVTCCDKCGKIRISLKNWYHPCCKSCGQKGRRHPEEVKQKISKGNKGKKRSEEAKKKVGDANRGEKNYWYGKRLSEEHRKKISDGQKGRKQSEEAKKKMSESRKGKKLSEEHKKKIREKRKDMPTHHTKPERTFEEICKKKNLPFKYTGDGSFWIENINPDFVDVDGKKIVVEIFGDYWHSPLLRGNIPYNQTYEGRKNTLKKYGWELIVFWEADLKREDAEQFVLSELQKFKVV